MQAHLADIQNDGGLLDRHVLLMDQVDELVDACQIDDTVNTCHIGHQHCIREGPDACTHHAILIYVCRSRKLMGWGLPFLLSRSLSCLKAFLPQVIAYMVLREALRFSGVLGILVSLVGVFLQSQPPFLFGSSTSSSGGSSGAGGGSEGTGGTDSGGEGDVSELFGKATLISISNLDLRYSSAGT